jgi:hypothetical protein
MSGKGVAFRIDVILQSVNELRQGLLYEIKYVIMLLVMLILWVWVYIHTDHTGQAWKICLSTVGIEPTTFGTLAHVIMLLYMLWRGYVSVNSSGALPPLATPRQLAISGKKMAMSPPQGRVGRY